MYLASWRLRGYGYAAVVDLMDNPPKGRVTHKFHNCLDNALR